MRRWATVIDIGPLRPADRAANAGALYDRVARFHGFIRYDYPLD